MKTTLKLAMAPLLALLAHTAAAQNVLFDDIAVPAAFPEPEGRMLGPLKLDGEVNAGMLASNNVYRDASHLSSEANVLGLTSSLTSAGERHLIIGTLEYYAQNFRDEEFKELDVDATTLTLFGRFVTSDMTNLRLLVIDEEDILGKEQADQLNSFTTGLEKNRRYEAIYEINGSQFFGNAMARYDKVDSQSFSHSPTELLDEALDRSERDYILLAGRSFDWGRAFVFGGTQEVRYESNSGPELAERNSDENRYGIGTEYEIGRFSGDADIYRFTQRFNSDAIRDIENAWVGSGRLNFAATDSFTVVLSMERKFHETNIASSGGIFSEDIFIGGAFTLSPSLYLRIGPSHNTSTIHNTPVEIKRYELDAELAWKFSPNFKLQLNTNIFVQEPNHAQLAGFRAQQASSTVSISYSL